MLAPEGWHEIPFSKWRIIVEQQRAHDLDKEENFDKFVSLIVEVFFDLDEAFILKLDYSVVYGLYEFVSWIGDTKATDKRSFEFQGETYWFPQNDLENTIWEQWLDSQTMMRKFKDNPEEGILWALALYCRDYSEPYSQKKMDKRRKLFTELDMQTVWDFNFFLSKRSDSLRKTGPIYGYLLEKERQMRSLRSTDGSQVM